MTLPSDSSYAAVEPIVDELAYRLVNHPYGMMVFNGVDPKLAYEVSKVLSGPKWECRKIGFGYDARFNQIRLRLHNEFGCAKKYMKELWEQPWASLLPEDAGEHFIHSGNPRMIDFDGPYKNCMQEPDYCVFPTLSNGRYRFPSIVIQEGTSDMHTHLIRDKDLWLNGTFGDTRVVILIEVTRIISGVQAVLEIWRKDRISQRITLMPVPREAPASQPDPFITVGELYGARGVPDGFDPETKLPLDLMRLRCTILGTVSWMYGLPPTPNVTEDVDDWGL
ncbi:hypothetical protein Dda_4707 [Drechslerella dactyloides]|uniref:Uncharacterized protein n=1 Tax=Drechslerella dactyloides TaxID=74499 RepID=A0AAD6IXV2_DREDA|nr:hypothetical protein Dda_4707 [Drechslerella dactyloides]